MQNRSTHTVLNRLARLEGQLRPHPTTAHQQDASNTSVHHCSPPPDGRTTMDRERKNGSFNIQLLTNFLAGGEEHAKYRDYVMREIEKDPILFDAGFYDRTRPEARDIVVRKMRRFLELRPSDDLEKAKVWSDLIGLYDPSFSTRWAVHSILFVGAILGQGTQDLIDKYINDCRNLRVIGCFCMTEMGHGSAIRHFETTATYDQPTDSFIINTPTLTATKWWIGGAGHIATHTICFARLIINGTDYGVHSFVVPLRNREGETLPGITIGDCGKKMGRDGIDNGWVQFRNVRVPRTNMLMKWARVDSKGVYHQPPKAQLAYGALLGGRVALISNCAENLQRGLIIAIRYSVIRRQFALGKADTELQIMDYQTHQARLLEPLSGAYAWHLTGRVLAQDNKRLQEELSRGELASLPDLHATSAGLKAFCTWYIHTALEQARQCMGGHGYSAYAGIPTIVSDFAVNCTWEGDNTVMALQTAQYLIKSVTHMLEGKPLVGSVRYLSRAASILQQTSFPANSPADLENPEIIVGAFERAAVKKVTRAARQVQREMKTFGKNKSEAWNACLTDLVEAAEAHCYLYVITAFLRELNNVPQDDAHKPVAAVLNRLFQLFALSRILKTAAVFLVDGWINEKQLEMIGAKVRELLLEIRRDAIALTDAFGFTDALVNSPLGRADGMLYEHYMETVKAAPGAIGKAPYWDELIKPCLRQDL